MTLPSSFYWVPLANLCIPWNLFNKLKFRVQSKQFTLTPTMIWCTFIIHKIMVKLSLYHADRLDFFLAYTKTSTSDICHRPNNAHCLLTHHWVLAVSHFPQSDLKRINNANLSNSVFQNRTGNVWTCWQFSYYIS